MPKLPQQHNGQLTPSPVPSAGNLAGKILTTRVGLRFPANTTYERWESAGVQISRIVDSSAWCLADWLVYGQDRYTDRYQQAVHAAGLDYQTLRNYAWVARRFEFSRRRDGLSFQHHAEVAALSDRDQDRWLEEAARGGWSRNELRRRLRESRRTAPRQLAKSGHLPRISTAETTLQRWRQAADHAGEQFEQWVIATLDRAATLTLDRQPPASSSLPGGPTGGAAGHGTAGPARPAA